MVYDVSLTKCEPRAFCKWQVVNTKHMRKHVGHFFKINISETNPAAPSLFP